MYLIQGDSGGKVNILGGDSIGHCEKIISYQQVSNSEWFTKTDFFESTNKNALQMIITKKKSLSVTLILI